jgi:hypothetical protein
MRAFLATPEVRPEGVTLSRRRLLADAGAAVAVTVLAAPGPSSAAASLDAELLASYDDVNRLRDWMDGPELGDADAPEEAVNEYDRLIGVIAALPAFTAQGVEAKLQTFTREIQGNDYSHVSASRTEGLFPQLIRTALEGAQRMAGGAA